MCVIFTVRRVTSKLSALQVKKIKPDPKKPSSFLIVVIYIYILIQMEIIIRYFIILDRLQVKK